MSTGMQGTTQSALSLSGASQLRTPDGGDYQTTAGQAGSLGDANLRLRQKYDTPTIFPANTNEDALRRLGLNPQEALPARYDMPTQAKEDLQRRHEIIKTYAAMPNMDKVNPTFTIGTDAEVAALASAEERKQLAEFDAYVAKLIDPKKPGNLQWLMNIYPEYVTRRIAQIHADHKYALDNTMIEAWGVNTFDDLFMKFMIDNQKLGGPMLAQRTDPSPGATFQPGMLSIFRDADKRAGAGDMDAAPYARDMFRFAPTGRNPATNAGQMAADRISADGSDGNKLFQRGTGPFDSLVAGLFPPVAAVPSSVASSSGPPPVT